MTPRARRTALPARADSGSSPDLAARDVRWLRPATAAPRTVALGAIAARVEATGSIEPAEWRATQLVALLVGADLDGGPGSAAALWDQGVPLGALALASRAGLPVDETETAIERLIRAGAVVPVDGAAEPRDVPTVRVAEGCITDGPAAAVSWATVTAALAGSAAALLVARALADCADRPGRSIVVPYSVLCRATRYSEGMIKRGVAAVVTAGVVTQHVSAGRAPAYAFSDWALGRADVPGPAAAARAIESPAPDVAAVAPAPPPLSMGVAPGMLRASVAGIEAEIPAATGGELVIETVMDGRPITARLIIPAVRTQEADPRCSGG